MAVSTSIAPATSSFLWMGSKVGRSLHPYRSSGWRKFWREGKFRNSITTQGVSGSEGGMLTKVDIVSAAVELDDLVESVELLVALGGGQSGGNSSFSRLSLSLSSYFLAKVFTSFVYDGWAHSMRVLLAVRTLVTFLKMGGWMLT
eukprot:scaffold42043_cov73-Attheya_sp.AAC.5